MKRGISYFKNNYIRGLVFVIIIFVALSVLFFVYNFEKDKNAFKIYESDTSSFSKVLDTNFAQKPLPSSGFCGEGQDCGDCEFCNDWGKCVYDCGSKEKCVDGECQSLDYCTSDSQCSSCESCIDGDCYSNCGDCETCSSGKCVYSCSDDEECDGDTCYPLYDCSSDEECGDCSSCNDGYCEYNCGEDQECDDGTCADMQCTSDGDCDSDNCEVCEADQCVSDCGQNQECDGNENCVDNSVCETDGDCGACEECDTDTGECKSSCDSNNCETCQDSECVSSCEQDQNCDEIGECKSNTCVLDKCSKDCTICDACTESCQSDGKCHLISCGGGITGNVVGDGESGGCVFDYVVRAVETPMPYPWNIILKGAATRNFFKVPQKDWECLVKKHLGEAAFKSEFISNMPKEFSSYFMVKKKSQSKSDVVKKFEEQAAAFGLSPAEIACILSIINGAMSDSDQLSYGDSIMITTGCGNPKIEFTLSKKKKSLDISDKCQIDAINKFEQKALETEGDFLIDGRTEKQVPIDEIWKLYESESDKCK